MGMECDSEQHFFDEKVVRAPKNSTPKKRTRAVVSLDRPQCPSVLRTCTIRRARLLDVRHTCAQPGAVWGSAPPAALSEKRGESRMRTK
eukprot:1194039-Prorocentrum_minimum.AAC.3